MTKVTAIFKPRPDGRTKADVVLDLIGDAPPDTVFTYEQIIEELDNGGDHSHDLREVQAAVRQANKRLQDLRKRLLVNVITVGYRVAQAREHLGVVHTRIRRSDRQIREAMRAGESARLDEMTEQQRNLHIAQMTINSEVYTQLRRTRQDQKRMADLIARLTHRMDQAGV
jgi:bacterioferritin-associated ferredoxin